MPIQLSERDPRVPADRLITELVPPPVFAEVSFDSYQPDPAQPSQQQAVELRRVRDPLDRLREHRLDGRHHGQVHDRSLGN